MPRALDEKENGSVSPWAGWSPVGMISTPPSGRYPSPGCSRSPGPGGVGKTRLALELAFRSGSRFPDGAWLVRLADLSIGAGVQEVESAIVDALGVSDQSATAPREKLLSFLGNRKLLVVLDNCEHVLSSVRATLPVMLAGAPQLRVIATSREPLGITGEVLRPVLPLSVPEAGAPAQQLIADGSVSLLVDRARAVDPDFVITDDNAAGVAQLCRTLEGIPWPSSLLPPNSGS